MSFRLTAAFAVLLLSLGSAARAEDLSPEQLAKVRNDEQQAIDKVNAEHGNKKPSEMDSAERRQVIEEQRKASQEALERNGVSAKDYARANTRMHGEDREKMEATSKQLKDKQEAEKKAAAAPKEAKKAAPGPVVEHGLPKDEQQEALAPKGWKGPRGGGSSHHKSKSGSKHPKQ